MAYENLKKRLDAKGLKSKEKVKPTKRFKNLNTGEKDALLERMAIDLGYIDPFEGDKNKK